MKTNVDGLSVVVDGTKNNVCGQNVAFLMLRADGTIIC